MEAIPVYKRGEVVAHALVDDEDYLRLRDFTWGLTSNGYARRSESRSSKVFMHREVMGLMPGDGLEVDHRDLDRLNNRRANLRVVTHAENGQNRVSQSTCCGRPVSSRFRGVTWDKERQKWQAKLELHGRTRYVGRYPSEVDAAAAVTRARLEAMTHTIEEEPACL